MCVSKDKEKMEFLDRAAIAIAPKLREYFIEKDGPWSAREVSEESYNQAEALWQERERRYGVKDGE